MSSVFACLSCLHAHVESVFLFAPLYQSMSVHSLCLFVACVKPSGCDMVPPGTMVNSTAARASIPIQLRAGAAVEQTTCTTLCIGTMLEPLWSKALWCDNMSEPVRALQDPPSRADLVVLAPFMKNVGLPSFTATTCWENEIRTCASDDELTIDLLIDSNVLDTAPLRPRAPPQRAVHTHTVGIHSMLHIMATAIIHISVHVAHFAACLVMKLLMQIAWFIPYALVMTPLAISVATCLCLVCCLLALESIDFP